MESVSLPVLSNGTDDTQKKLYIIYLNSNIIYYEDFTH